MAFTGGDATGQRVYEAAAGGIKPVTLELGGKSANIVFDDADLDAAVNGVVSGIFAATGQTCIAGSRVLVQRPIYDEVVEQLVALARTARMGDPLDAETAGRPDHHRAAAREGPRLYRHRQGAKARAASSAAARRTRPSCGDGLFVEPTIFADVTPDMRIAQEEVFGPVCRSSRSTTRTRPSRSPTTRSTASRPASGPRTSGARSSMPERLEAGTVWVNTYRATSYLSPFGGYKRSGIGRESGRTAIQQYLQGKRACGSTSPARPRTLRAALVTGCDAGTWVPAFSG